MTDKSNKIKDGTWGIMQRSLIQIVRRPIYWVGIFALPLFLFLFFTTMLDKGLPTRVPAAMVDMDGSRISREMTQNLGGMQLVHITETPQTFSEARSLMQEGKIYGFFVIPANFQANLLAGRKPVITFYTNMTYFVPGSMLFKTFKTTAIFTKASVAMNVVSVAGINGEEMMPLMQPVNIQARGIGNPQLNYGIYIANSFIPAIIQLMIMLMTCFSLGQELKYGTSVRLMKMSHGSIMRALFGKLFPQTVIWWIIAIFMTSWLYRWNGYPMHGSWFWLIVSEMMFVVACQCFAVFIFGIVPNLRLSLSVSALLGILSFSIAAFSFPVQSMYGGLAIFSYIVPIRYNFLIYADQALNGIHIAYSKMWFVAYIIFMVLPFTLAWRIKREMKQPVYVP